MHEATTNSDKNLVAFLDLDIDSFLSELVDALALPEEHDLEFRSLWVTIQIASEGFVYFVILMPNIYRLPFLQLFIRFNQLSYLELETLICILQIFQLIYEVKLRRLHLKNLLLHLDAFLFQRHDDDFELATSFLGFIKVSLQLKNDSALSCDFLGLASY